MLYTPPRSGPGNHVVSVHTGNGMGSVGTAVSRFTTVRQNVGTAITYADSAANGASFTINEAGFYSCVMTQANPSPGNGGLTLNASSLTNEPQILPASERIVTLISNTTGASISAVIFCNVGDVIRHGDAGSPAANDKTSVSIRKVGVL